MFFYDDTFPVRQPHLSLSPQILKFLPAVTLQISHSHILALQRPLLLFAWSHQPGCRPWGFPPQEGAGWLSGQAEPLQGGYDALLPCAPQGWGSRRGWSLPGPSSSQCFSHRFSKAHAASAQRMLLLLHPPSAASFSPTPPPPAEVPGAPKMPRSPSTLYTGGGFPLAHLMLNILHTHHGARSLRGCLPHPGSCEVVSDFSLTQHLLLYAKHYITSEILIPSQNQSTKGEAVHNPLHLLASISRVGLVVLVQTGCSVPRQCSEAAAVSLTHYGSSLMLLQHNANWVLLVKLAHNRHTVLF